MATGNAAYLGKKFGTKIAMHNSDSGMIEYGNMIWNRKKPFILIRWSLSFSGLANWKDFGIKFKAQPNYEADPAAAYNIVKGNESVTAVPTTVEGNEPEKKSP